ncbi:hypothetical protein IFR05_015657 [Cadophora sp. M221]|nr:hypothetical protein IFR05_015657 [Cadophora sp. M221]
MLFGGSLRLTCLPRYRLKLDHSTSIKEYESSYFKTDFDIDTELCLIFYTGNSYNPANIDHRQYFNHFIYTNSYPNPDTDTNSKFNSKLISSFWSTKHADNRRNSQRCRRHDEPRLTSATPPPRSGQSTPNQAPTSSRGVQPAAGAGSGSGYGELGPTTPIIDRPLPDPEKSTITPPPVHEHPIFHPLPGQSADIPTYHPGVPVNLNLTPIAPLKSTMRSHPTYHISQLTTHPIFRASKPPTPPRESGFPQRTPEVRKYRSLSPVQSSSRHQNQNQAHEQQQHQQAWRHSYLSSPRTSTLTSPILGRSELEADVPSTYLTPATTAYNTPRADFDYTNKYTDRRSLMTPISRGNTDSSKYSIPIGLGLESKSTSTSTSNPNPTLNRDTYTRDRKPSPPLQYRNSEIRHNLDPPTPDLVVSPLSISTQMVGPLGPNLNSPRDGGHIMSWASDAYGHGYASPPTSREHERAWAQERVYRPSDEKEVVSPMTPERWSGATAVQMSSPGGVGDATPLSAESEALSPEAGTGTWGSWSGR